MPVSKWTIYGLLIMLAATLTGCSEWELERIEFPELITLDPVNSPNLPTTSVSLGARIQGLLNDRVGLVTQPGHVYSSENTDPLLENSQRKSAAPQLGNGDFETLITDLTPGRRYYYRAYAFYQNEVVYAREVKSFVVGEIMPQVSVDSIFEIVTGTNASTARVAGQLSGFSEGIILSDYGVVWGGDSLPDLNKGTIVSQGSLEIGTTIVPINVTISILDPGPYFVRTYAQVGDTVFYSPQALCLFIGDIWQAGTVFPGEAFESGAVFVLDGKAYLGCPNLETADLSTLNRIWRYDPVLDVWDTIAPFPGPDRDDAVGFAIETDGFKRGYMGTGSKDESILFSDFYEYNPETNSWREVDSIPGHTGLDDGIAFSINGKGYFGIAQRGSTPISTFYEYDPDNGPLGKWREVAPFEGRIRGDAVAFVIDTIGYVTSGEEGIPFSDLWAFNPSVGEKGQWTEKAPMPQEVAREDAVGFSVAGKGYVCTGWNRDNIQYFTDLWEYDPKDGPSGNWRKRANFPGTERLSAVGFTIGNRAYVGTGFNGAFFADFWKYTPLLTCEE